MKKILIVMLGCLNLVTAFSQVEKGSKLVGVSLGSLSYTNSNNKTSYSNTTTVYDSDGNTFSVSLNPNVAWFVTDNLAVGGSVTLGFNTNNSTSSNTGSANSSHYTSNQPSIYIGPYARYYFSGGTKGRFFQQLNVQFGIYGGRSKSTGSSGSVSETRTIPKGDWNAGIAFGYEYFINQYIGIYSSVGINYGKTKTEFEYKPASGTGYTYNTEYSRFYLPLTLGLQIHIPSGDK
jgi:hypothetical protein